MREGAVSGENPHLATERCMIRFDAGWSHPPEEEVVGEAVVGRHHSSPCLAVLNADRHVLLRTSEEVVTIEVARNQLQNVRELMN